MMKAEEAKDCPGVIAFPPLLWLGAAALSGLAHFLFPIRLMPGDGAVPFGIALAVTALALAIWAARTMKVAGTNVNPNQPALVIVRAGPYRFTRNPMYIALCLLQLALAFLLNDWSALVLILPLAVLLHYGVILREERYLEAKFGAQYLALKHQVRRWF